MPSNLLVLACMRLQQFAVVMGSEPNIVDCATLFVGLQTTSESVPEGNINFTLNSD